MEKGEVCKGCVYFFRHIGLSPVKIGYSAHESPMSRFEQFKTYAPYGSEIIGFIQTDKAHELEKILHVKFASKRLSGEWFELTSKECEQTIKLYSSFEDIKEKNDFQIAWAKHLNEKNIKKEIVNEIITIERIEEGTNRKNFIINYLKTNPKAKVKDIAILARCSKKTVYQYKNELIKQGVNF